MPACRRREFDIDLAVRGVVGGAQGDPLADLQRSALAADAGAAGGDEVAGQGDFTPLAAERRERVQTQFESARLACIEPHAG